MWCQGGGVYRPSSSLRPAQPPASAPFAARRQLASPTSTELWSLPPPPPSIVMRSWDCPFSQAVLPPHRCCQWRVSPLCASLCALLDYVPPAVPQFSPTPSPVHLRTCSPPSVPPTAALATALESTMALAEWLTHCATTPGAGACWVAGRRCLYSRDKPAWRSACHRLATAVAPASPATAARRGGGSVAGA